MDYIEFFTEAINEYRIQNNLNISQFAERLGVSEQCVSNWLTRHNGPSLELLISVANLLNCSLDYLVGRSQSPEYVPADNGFIFNERLSLLLKNNNLSAFKLAKACGFGDSILQNGKRENSEYYHSSFHLGIFQCFPRLSRRKVGFRINIFIVTLKQICKSM